MAEKITKSYPIGSEQFQSILMNNFKIRNLYAKNITFACSLPTSTSTWHSDHCIRPSGYMSGELKSENINTKKAPTRRSYHLAKDPQLSHHIQPHPRKILVPYTRLFYNTRKALKELQPRPSSIEQDPHRIAVLT
jgi:hypothetical protein